MTFLVSALIGLGLGWAATKLTKSPDDLVTNMVWGWIVAEVAVAAFCGTPIRLGFDAGNGRAPAVVASRDAAVAPLRAPYQFGDPR
jgi:hypothetical protein